MTEQRWPHGIPPDATFKQLLYSHGADMLVVRLIRRSVSSQEEFYARRSNDSTYELLPLPSGYAYRSVCVSSGTPQLFALQWRQHPEGDDWTGVICLNLLDMSLSVLQDVDIPSSGQRHWIVSLHGTSSDGHKLFCVVATERRTGELSSAVTYELCSFDIPSRSLVVISHLQAGFM